MNVNPQNVIKHGAPNEIIYIPKGLTIIQRGVRLEHYEIVPTYPMDLYTFQSLLNQIITVPIYYY